MQKHIRDHSSSFNSKTISLGILSNNEIVRLKGLEL